MLPFAATSGGPAQMAKWSTHLYGATEATPPSPPTSAAESDGRDWDGTCYVMAAIAASSAKRSLRTELKQRLRALSAEERLRQSHLLTQKVREGCEELNAWKLGLGWHVCAGAPLPPAPTLRARPRGRALAPPGWPGRAPGRRVARSFSGQADGHVCSFKRSSFAVVDTHCREL